mmetsp:Transcript_3639/g.11403  ORF Transcript_3639/g.11403 Transcript_3639/m.11403 type:complete len:292 (-) Transcript_3639:6-881(-)
MQVPQFLAEFGRDRRHHRGSGIHKVPPAGLPTLQSLDMGLGYITDVTHVDANLRDDGETTFEQSGTHSGRRVFARLQHRSLDVRRVHGAELQPVVVGILSGCPFCQRLRLGIRFNSFDIRPVGRSKVPLCAIGPARYGCHRRGEYNPDDTRGLASFEHLYSAFYRRFDEFVLILRCDQRERRRHMRAQCAALGSLHPGFTGGVEGDLGQLDRWHRGKDRLPLLTPRSDGAADIIASVCACLGNVQSHKPGDSRHKNAPFPVLSRGGSRHLESECLSHLVNPLSGDDTCFGQ